MQLLTYLCVMDIPLLQEVHECYDRGDMDMMKDSSLIIYHLNEERRELGPKYAIISTFRAYKDMRHVGKQMQEEQSRMFWPDTLTKAIKEFYNGKELE